MTKRIFFTIAACMLSAGVFAQKSDGSTRSLVNAEKEFAKSLAKEGQKKAYLAYTGKDAIVFRPNPISAKTFYATQDDSKDLSWQPVYAKVSRSGDWGFTTGPYTYNGTEKSYGQFLSIWKTRMGRWELVIDLGINHSKPLKPTTDTFVEPTGGYTPKIFPDKDATVGREIIVNTESTLNTTLKTYGPVALSGFLNDNARLLFPGNEPIIGKENIIAFNNTMVSKLNLKTAMADKAVSGELAYTFGVATIDYKADLRESFNYVFVWELQKDHNWNIILQMFVPAER